MSWINKSKQTYLVIQIIFFCLLVTKDQKQSQQEAQMLISVS